MKSALVVVIVGSGLVVGCGGGSAKGDASDAAKGDAPAEVGAADGGGEASAPDVAMTVDAAPDLASDAAPNDVAGDARGDKATGDAQADGGSDAAVPFLTPYPRFVSGTRLRARYVKDENGTSAQTILRDTTLDVDCAFEPAETGVTRCVPVDRGYVVFADAQCKNPLAQSGLCYLKKWAGLSDSTGNHVYKVDVGGVVTKPTTIWLAGEDENGAATCTASATAAGDQFVPAQLQPDSSFVAATGAPVTETRPGARIGARYWVGADNSKAYVGLYDNARAANCDVLPVGTGARRCFSGVQPATMIYFGDAQCSVQLFMSPGANAPAYARATRQPAANEPSCAGGRWTMRKIGPKHTGQLYRRSGTACTPATAPAGSTPYTLEDGDVGAQLLVTLTDELQGGPRLKALGLRGSDGSAVDGDGQRFIDTKFNETCTATLFDVGDHYCAPAFTGAAEGYADAACSIVAYQYPDEACLYEGGTVATHHVIFKDGGCGERVATEVWLRGAAVTPLYDTAGGTCGVVPGNTSLYYRRAQSPPPSTFAWVDVKTE